MGIYDRDYMRRGEKKPSEEVRELITNRPSWQALAMVGIAVLLVLAAIWPRNSDKAQAYLPDESYYEQNYGKSLDPIDINEATLEEIMSVPALDNEMAQGIMEKRPFETVEDLLDVRGIGKQNLMIIRQYIYVDND